MPTPPPDDFDTRARAMEPDAAAVAAAGLPRAGGGDPGRYLGSPLPEAEARMWALMSVDRRAKAIQRMKVLSSWRPEADGADVTSAARDAGVGVTRFYEMAKAWRERPSLASLGTFGAAPRTRRGPYDAALRQALGAVVPEGYEGSAAALVPALAAASGVPAEDLPSDSTLRRYVEQELLRRRRREGAGRHLRLDCCPCRLGPTATDVHFLYAVLDDATQVVLGAALAMPDDSRSGYGAAARDALARLSRGVFERLPWADGMDHAEIVAGDDIDAWSGIADEARAAGVEAQVEPSTTSTRFGRYLKALSGLRIGRVALVPGRRALEHVRPAEGAEAWLAVEVDEYNEAVMEGWTGGGAPPAGMMRLLALLAGR